MPLKSLSYSRVPKDRLGNLELRKKLWDWGYESKAHQKYLYDACKEDILLYFNLFMWTEDPRKTAQPHLPFITYEEYQDDGILAIQSAIDNGEDLGTEKSRDMGMSWCELGVFDWNWRFHDSRKFLVASRKEDLVDKTGNPDTLFAKLDYIERKLPLFLQAPRRVRTNLHIGNPDTGSVIDGESTTGDIGRGGRRTAIFLDEFAFVPNGLQVEKATGQTTRCRLFGSTPNGTGNSYHRIVTHGHTKVLTWHWSMHPEKKVGLYRLHSSGEIEHLDPDYDYTGYDYAKTNFQSPDSKFYGLHSEWYDKECKKNHFVRAIIAAEYDIDYGGSDGKYFDSEAISDLRENCREPLHIGHANEWIDHLGVNDMGLTPLRLWFHPTADKKVPQDTVYAMGIDVSQGTGASDSCISVADKRTGEKVASYMTNRLLPQDFAKLAAAIANWFSTPQGYCLMAWEGNGPGSVFGKAIVENIHYPHLYYHKVGDTKGAKRSKRPGWFSNKELKQELFDKYRDALFKRQFINRELVALAQCEDYVFDKNSGIVHVKARDSQIASESKDNHGDMVIADAIAWTALARQSNPPKPEKKIRVGTLADRRRRYAEYKRQSMQEAW